jgi:toxin HigB-1
MLDQAGDLRDVATPGNQLEKLEGDRKGQYSIRINDQYRICFTRKDGDAFEVEIAKHYD